MEIIIKLRNGREFQTKTEREVFKEVMLKKSAGWIVTNDIAVRPEDVLMIKKVN